MTERRWADVRGLRTDGSVAAIAASADSELVTVSYSRGRVIHRQRLVVTAEAYATGEAVGGRLEISGVGRSGKIIDARVYDDANNVVAYEVFLSTDPNFTITTDGAAFAPTDGELIRMASDPVQIANGHTYSTNAVIASGAVEYDYETSDGSMVGQLVVRGAPTYAATTDVLLQITFVPDVVA